MTLLSISKMISMEIVFQVVHLFMVLVEGLLPGMEMNFILWIPIIQKLKQIY